MQKDNESLDRAGLAYVKQVLAKTGLRPTVLAKRAGISTTTITRALNDPEEFGGFHASTINKIYAATGIEPEGALLGVVSPQRDQKSLNEDDLIACMELVEEWLDSHKRKADVITKSKVIAVGLWPSINGVRAEHPDVDIDQMKDALRDKVDVAMRMAGVS